MKHALNGAEAAVRDAIASGVPVDTCGEWTECEDSAFGNYEKAWDWKKDTARTRDIAKSLWEGEGQQNTASVSAKQQAVPVEHAAYTIPPRRP